MNIRVEFEIDLPETAMHPTVDQIEAWPRFELNDSGEIAMGNSLDGFDVEPRFGSLERKIVRPRNEARV